MEDINKIKSKLKEVKDTGQRIIDRMKRYFDLTKIVKQQGQDTKQGKNGV